MNQGQELSESLEDYLEAIYRLILEKNAARVKDIAGALKVRYPSVTAALGVLEKRGLIHHERYGGVTLSKAGYAAAVDVTERHRLLRGFFSNVLGCNPIVADETACRVEHVLPGDVFSRLTQFIKYLYVSHDDPEEWIREFSRFAEGEGAAANEDADNGVKTAMKDYFSGTTFVLEGETHDD